jgi:Spy/CpxP family protein refolding chaperone
MFVPAIALVLAVTFVAAAQERQPARRSRGSRGSRSSLLGLVSLEQVQKEMKLNEEQIGKVKKVVETLTAERRKEYGALREIEDRAKRTAKYTELRKKFDGKAREQLGAVVPREQMIRLYQIRLQVRPVLDSLGQKYVAGKLKLTDDQKKKLTEISKDMQAEWTKLSSSMRDATREKRSEAYAKYRTLRTDADKKALEVLTAPQKKTFEEMKGEAFKLESRGPRPAKPAAEK